MGTTTKTLYVHIGTAKTGTTAIQGLCAESGEFLEKRGYAYPIFPYTYPHVHKNRNAHFLFGTSGKMAEEEERLRFREGMEQIHELFKRVDNVILSEESLWTASLRGRKSLWEELKCESEMGGYQVKVVVYLRRQDQFLTSNWKQMIKSGNYNDSSLTWEAYLKKRKKLTNLDYYKNLERISSILGKENVIVRRFENGAFYGGSIYADFFHAIGIEGIEELEISQDVRNNSLTENECEIKRVLNGLPQMDENMNSIFRHMLLSISETSAAQYQCGMLSVDETNALLDQYEEDNNRIAIEYLGDTEHPMFERKIADVPKFEKNNPHMQDDMIRFVGVSCMYLMEENEKLRTEIKNIRDSLRHPFRTFFGKIWKRVRGA